MLRSAHVKKNQKNTEHQTSNHVNTKKTETDGVMQFERSLERPSSAPGGSRRILNKLIIF